MRLIYILLTGVLCILCISEKCKAAEAAETAEERENPTSAARNCLDIKKQGKESGSYFITPCDDTPSKVVRVYCDMDIDGGGWTMIQRRGDFNTTTEDSTEKFIPQNFENSWYEYAIGFGDVSKEFWLGNDNIHCLTQQSHHEIRIDLAIFSGNGSYAKYGFFYVDDRANEYTLDVHEYSGNAGDGWMNHRKVPFSINKCQSSGGWWFICDHFFNLNAPYRVGSGYSYLNYVTWGTREGSWSRSISPFRVTQSEMKIRAKYQ